MDNGLQTSSQQKREEVRSALEAARTMQNDWLQYGLDFVQRCVEDWDGDWLENWGEDSEGKTTLESLIAFLSSDDWIAVKVRKQLKDKSLQDVAAELEKCFLLPTEENKVFAVKTVLTDSVKERKVYRSIINEDTEINLLDLAEELVERLTTIYGQ